MTYGSSKWREWVLDEEASRPLIKQALEAGINFFDTADMYSLGASEEVLGRALKDFGPAARQSRHRHESILSGRRRPESARTLAQAHHARGRCQLAPARD